MESCGKLGLANLGNTCYVNSVIQCLAHILIVASSFKKFKQRCNDPVHAFSRLIGHLSEPNDSLFLEPTVFYEMILKECPELICCRQEDAQEFLRLLLVLIHENLEKDRANLRLESILPRKKNELNLKDLQSSYSV